MLIAWLMGGFVRYICAKCINEVKRIILIKCVEGSNYVDIGFKIDERTGRIIMMGAIDNLVKGAAGQAVQNMNLLFGLPESEGLELVPMFP